jgi:pyrimidine-nucleoside phosphorylase
VEQLASGAAWRKFIEFVRRQKGDVSYLEHPERLPTAPARKLLTAPEDGHLARLNAREVGLTVVELGGGRAKKEDAIDPSVGVVLRAKVGDRLAKGDPVLEVHARDEKQAEAAIERLRRACQYSGSPVAPLPLFYATIGG